MTHSDAPMMSLDEIIEYVMRVTGKTRRQAKYAVIEAARNGKLRTTGVNPCTNQREAIPPEAWPKVN
jgi:hypothetical protein